MGKFEKGHKKVGGRTKGTPNKITDDLRGLLNELGCNPIQGMALIAINPDHKVETRLHANAQIARYIHPQLQSIQLSGVGGKPIELDVETAARQRLADRTTRAASREGTE